MKRKKLLLFLLAGSLITFSPVLLTGEIGVKFENGDPFLSVDYLIRTSTFVIAILVILKGVNDYLE